MSKCDLVAICGMPRAGTTFLHNLFACEKLGNEFFAHHSKILEPHFPLSTHEPRYLNICYFYDIPIEQALVEIINYWRGQIKNPDATIIYKHPQLVFHGPIFETYELTVKYIFCYRIFKTWAESVHRYTNGGEGIARVSVGSIYHKFWGQDWQKPDELFDRYRYLYDRIKKCIIDFKKQLSSQQYVDFVYEDPVNSLINIFGMLGISANPQQMVDKYFKFKNI